MRLEGRSVARAMDVNEKIHEQLKKSGVTLAASLPDDFVAPLINRIAADNTMRHVRVAREAEAIAFAAGRSSAACVRWR